MRVTLVPSSVGPSLSASQYLTSILINDDVAIDAGCIGFYRGPEEQSKIKHVFLSHSHIDHVASLPIFLNNILSMVQGHPVTVYGSEAVLGSLQSDIFNGRVWPDFIRISEQGEPFVHLQVLKSGAAVTIDGLRVTPIDVDHVVPTHGFLVQDPEGAVVFASDTGPTQAIWALANRTKNLKAVFMEVTFPNELQWLAEVSKHLTPALFGQEMAKLNRKVPVVAVHLHSANRDQVSYQLAELGMPEIQVGEFGREYTF